MSSKYNEYIQKLKEDYVSVFKIDLLSPDNTVYREITSSYVDMSGTLSVNTNNGARRTCSLTLDNTNGEFSIGVNSIWYAQKIKIWAGIYIDDEPYFFPQGVFYVSSIQESNEPSVRTITIDLVDKWAFLDGSLCGYLDGIYQIPIGANIYSAIESLLLTSRFTGENVKTNNEPLSNAIDSTAPMFSSYYLNKTYSEPQTGKTYKAIETPYEIRMEYGKTYADVLLELATILGAYIFYDVDGRLTIEPTQDDIEDSSKPILWTFTPAEKEFMAEQSQSDFTSWYNDVMVVGYIINGHQAYGRVQNKNLSSPTSVQFNGLKTKEPYQDTTYYTDEQCIELANYYLKRLTILQRNVTITSAPIYHLRENRLIDCVRPYTFEKEPLLINGFSLPLGTTGTMEINATSINDLTFN